MSKILLLVSVTFILNNVGYPQTGVIQVYSSDSMSIGTIYKTNKSNQGYQNFYFQIFGYSNIPLIDIRNGVTYRYYKGSISSNFHGYMLGNSYAIYMNTFCWGYLTSIKISNSDTNYIFHSNTVAWWEPTHEVKLTTNNGVNNTTVNSNTAFDRFYGLDMSHSNDSVIMYIWYNIIPNQSFAVYKSTNRGTTWNVTDTLTYTLQKFLSISPFNTQVVFVSKYNSFNNYTLYRSTTGGTDFTANLPNITHVKAIEFDNTGSTYLVANGIFKSTNNGDNWTSLSIQNFNCLEIDPVNNNILYAGANDGLYKSTNGGFNWFLYNNAFSPSKNVIGIMKNAELGDTLLTATSKGVYKVFAPSNLEPLTYLPLHVGNRWVYIYQILPFPPLDTFDIKITKDSIINGKRFFYFDNKYPGTYYEDYNWVTFDSTTGNVIGIGETTNCRSTKFHILDSLGSSKNDTLNVCSNYKMICMDTISGNIFGQNLKSKIFRRMWTWVLDYSNTYTNNIGMSQWVINEVDFIVRSLKGCLINGVVYGDTSLTGIKQISNIVPANYELYQNYPNPFNPSTTIEFDVPREGFVEIKVFDLLGREIAVLVNQRMRNGRFNVTWNANDTPSGVYFYKLQADGFSVVRKMLLIK